MPVALANRGFTLADGRMAGVGRGVLRHERFGHPHHGVYADGLDEMELPDRCRALLPALSDGQAFSHATAARLLGVPLPHRYRHDEDLHVLTHGSRPPMRRPGVVGWETTGTEATLVGNGLPIVTPASLFGQLAVRGATGPGWAVGRHALVAVGDYLVTGERDRHGVKHPPLATLADLSAAVRARTRQRGVRALQWAMEFVREGPESPKETELRLALVLGGLPEPAVQLPVLTREGWRHADLGYEAERLLLEYQGDEHRTSRSRWLEDLTRVQLFQDAGYRVLLIGANDLRGEAHPLVRRVARALGA